jgi:hypothetical protein
VTGNVLPVTMPNALFSAVKVLEQCLRPDHTATATIYAIKTTDHPPLRPGQPPMRYIVELVALLVIVYALLSGSPH